MLARCLHMRRKLMPIILTLFPILIIVTTNVTTVNATTWSTQTYRLTDYPFFDGFPSLTQFEDETILIVWSENALENTSLFYSLSYDYGSTWSHQGNFTDIYAAGDDSNPSAVQLNNGTIFVVWASNRPPPPPPPEPDFCLTASPQNLTIRQGNSKNSTITVTSINNFNETVDLMVMGAPPGVNTVLNPTQVECSPNGNVTSILEVSVGATAVPGNYTFSVTGKSGKIVRSVNIYLEITTLETFSYTTSVPNFKAKKTGNNPLALGTTKAPAVDRRLSSRFAEKAGSEQVTQDYDIYYKVSHDSASSWSKGISLTSNDVDDVDPSVFQASNGTIYVLWSSNRNGNNDIFYKTSSDFGSSWSSEKQITHDTNRDNGSSIIQTQDGKFWVVWSSDRTGDYEIFYKTYDGSSWSIDKRLTYSNNSDSSPSILQTLDGTIWIFWGSDELSPTSNGDIYYKTSNDNGDTWSESVQFTTDNNEDTWPCAIQTCDTKIWVVWTSNRADQPNGNWDIYYRTSLAGDVNEDGIIDDLDLAKLSLSYGYFWWQPQYDPDVDLNKDGIVEMQDVLIICMNYGDT
jgi:hypothetical protein